MGDTTARGLFKTRSLDLSLLPITQRPRTAYMLVTNRVLDTANNGKTGKAGRLAVKTFVEGIGLDRDLMDSGTGPVVPGLSANLVAYVMF